MVELNLPSGDINTLHYSSTQEPDEGYGAPLPLQAQLQAPTFTNPMKMDTRPRGQVATGVYTRVLTSKHVPHKPQRKAPGLGKPLWLGGQGRLLHFPISPTTSAPLWEE